MVFRLPIFVIFAVWQVVFLLIAHQVAKRETVMTGDVVNALIRFATQARVKIRAAREPRGKTFHHSVIAAHKLTHVIAIPSIPFRPAFARKRSDLIESGRIPRFCNDLCLLQDWIGLDLPQQRRIGHRFAGFVARKNRSQIKAEAVHMHSRNPVAQRVQNHPSHQRMIAVDCVAAARVV